MEVPKLANLSHAHTLVIKTYSYSILPFRPPPYDLKCIESARLGASVFLFDSFP